MSNNFIVAVDEGQDWAFDPGVVDRVRTEFLGEATEELEVPGRGLMLSTRLVVDGSAVTVTRDPTGSSPSVAGPVNEAVAVVMWLRRATPRRVNLILMDSSYSFDHLELASETTADELIEAVLSG